MYNRPVRDEFTTDRAEIFYTYHTGVRIENAACGNLRRPLGGVLAVQNKVNVVNGASSTSLAARTAKWAPIERSRRDNSNGENRSSLSHSSQELQAVEIAVTRGSRDQGVHAERSAIIPHDDFRLFTLWRDHFFLHALVWVP